MSDYESIVNKLIAAANYIDALGGDSKDLRATLATLSHPATQAGALQAVKLPPLPKRHGFFENEQTTAGWTAEQVIAYARAALAATQPSAAPGDGQGAAPEGWKLVPINLTEGMLIAASEDYNHELVQNVWATLLSAAPGTATDAREQEVTLEAQRIVDRLMSDDPDFEDCEAAAKLIRDQIQGPAGYATWKDAAIAERVRRVKVEAVLASRPEAPAAPSAEGLPMTQEPKYTVNGSHIVNRASGEAIPHDEPIFIFRARDKAAIRALNDYAERIGKYPDSSQHYAAIRKRIKHFRAFASRFPDRMKWPDTAAPIASEPQPIAGSGGISSREGV